MSGALRAALRDLRARGARTLLAAAGIAASAAMLGTAVTVGLTLSAGFERSAQAADLPDVIARFDDARAAEVDARVRGLPNLDRRSYRRETTNVELWHPGGTTRRGAVQAVGPGPQGYAIVAGRDLSGAAREVVVEQGLSDAWGVVPGDLLGVAGLGRVRVAGVALAPDNVAFPLASAARVYLPAATWSGGERAPGRRAVNTLLLWVNDRDRLDETLVQARAVSFGIRDLRFVTRAGVAQLIDRAAGVVIALLVAFATVTLAVAALMLAAAAHSDVQRRLPSLGIQRTLGFSRGALAGRASLQAALVAVVAGGAGLAGGALVAQPPAARLVARLNQLPAGWELIPALALALVVIVVVVAAATAWPAWRATGRPPVELLRGAELRTGRTPVPRGTSAWSLGARLALARRARAATVVAVIAASAAVVLLMLGLSTLLVGLQEDPGALGRRYQLSAQLPPSRVQAVRALPGVQAVAPRYSLEAIDSFSLGETMRITAYPGDHTVFDAPALSEGRRLASDAEAEVGVGLAQALGLRPGATLAAQLPSGREVRFRVVGTVRALDNDGRVAYVRPSRLLRADPSLTAVIDVRLAPGADIETVAGRLEQLAAAESVLEGPGASGGVRRAGTATTRQSDFLGVLASVLRAVAAINGLVCLYALVQALSLTARERRPSISLLRACGADRATLTAVYAGSALAVTLPAAGLGILAERLLLAPLVAGLAAGYADLRPEAAPLQVLAVVGGLAVLALAAAGWVARRTAREPIVAGLREE